MKAVTQERVPDHALEIAHVLFMDIVSYSLLPMDIQSHVVSHLHEVVRRLPGFEQAIHTAQLICLPTGDGISVPRRSWST